MKMQPNEQNSQEVIFLLYVFFFIFLNNVLFENRNFLLSFLKQFSMIKININIK